ncbi:MAG: hypothetical protein Q8K77_04255 [Thermodesulfovibrionales bacterium]|nr:hypothetical protein [Thermodesulfovibrionales bacterium]
MIKDEVNAKVTQLAALLRDSYAKEYLDFRGIQIFRNEREELLVAAAVFTIEGFAGGNNYTQFLAVFANLEGLEKRLSLIDFMAVGGKGGRSIEFKKIKINITEKGILITVPTLEYGPDDAMCCPSVKSNATFLVEVYRGKRLEEIKQKKGANK